MKDNQPMSPNKPFEKKDVSAASGNTIVSAILRDHKPLKRLIPRLKDPKIGRSEKAEETEEFIFNLLCHATAEETSLYVHMKEHKDLKLEALEGDTEHGIATMLVQEINAAADDNEWLAKVKVLAELVENHVQEEEKEDGMLAHIAKMDQGMLAAVSDEYERIRSEFLSLNEPLPPKLVKFNETSKHLN